MKRMALISLILVLCFNMIGCTNEKSNPAVGKAVIWSGDIAFAIEDMVAKNTNSKSIKYINTQYGFEFTLPESWNGYTVVTGKWEGTPSGSETTTETGPELIIRNPLWTEEKPYQDIPIMVFTKTQWKDLQNDEYHIGAAPIGPSELGRNSKYVFALPSRYNFAFPAGYEEVENILKNKPLKTIEPVET